MENVEQTIISQYGNSPTLVQLIRNMNGYIDQSTNFANFYSFVWNVDTAQDWGLDIWGRIVDIGRAIEVGGTSVALDDQQYRLLILTKALVNISATTSPALNQVLQNMFAGRGRTYVNDLGGMAMRYVFEFALEPWELAVIESGNILPHPGGVEVILLPLALPLFGFVEQGIVTASPFDQGMFYQPDL